jgi:hypothetical protein
MVLASTVSRCGVVFVRELKAEESEEVLHVQQIF